MSNLNLHKSKKSSTFAAAEVMTENLIHKDMAKSFIRSCAILMAVLLTTGVMAAEYSYVWSTEFPNYKSQIPSSDFTTNDGLFRFTSEKAQGVSGPQFGADSKAGLLLRLYADNTLRIESLKGEKITVKIGRAHV